MRLSSGPFSLLPQRSFIALLLALTCPLSAAIRAEETGAAPRAAMADAMSRMMEAMGLFNPPAPPGMPSGTPPMGMPAPPSWPPSATDPGGLMAKGSEMMKDWSAGMSKPADMAAMVPWSKDSRLDGVWEGRNGELLIVQGNRFRIYPGTSNYVDGFIHLDGERLALYHSENAHISPFEFAESEGRLALRDRSGNLYLYRRLWWEQPAHPGPSPAPSLAK